MDTIGDPSFAYHRLCAQYWGLVALKLIDAELLPLNLSLYATALKEYVVETYQLAKNESVSVDGFTLLFNAVSDFTSACEKFQLAVSNGLYTQTTANERAFKLERQFISPNGIPGRYWYKHLLIAPGLSKGYGDDVLPGVTDAIRAKNETQATNELTRVREAVEKATNWLLHGDEL